MWSSGKIGKYYGRDRSIWVMLVADILAECLAKKAFLVQQHFTPTTDTALTGFGHFVVNIPSL